MKKIRVDCETINKQNKLPCKAPGILCKNGNIRCRVHGGYSTGPKSAKTTEGKIKLLKNLKLKNYERIATDIRNRELNHNSIDERNTINQDLQSQR
ncbi:MAG: hypothetical protein RIT11_66 [Pseudomonadota bacterium]|jgi:hypothetical protein